MSAEGLLMTPRRTDTDGFYVSVLARTWFGHLCRLGSASCPAGTGLIAKPGSKGRRWRSISAFGGMPAEGAVVFVQHLPENNWPRPW